MQFKNIYSSIITPIILVFIFLSSCDDQTIDPIEEDGGIYSFYGVIQVGQSPNHVRIRDLNEPFLSPSDSFNGEVTFEDLETGIVTTLRDSIVEFDGNFTHNFIIEEEIELNKEYLLKAVRSDGEMVQSVAKTPGVTEVQFLPTENITCETPIEFRFQNVIEPELIEIELSVEHDGQIHRAGLELFIDELEFSQTSANEMNIELSPRNILTEIFTPVLPDNPNFNPFNFFPTVPCQQIHQKEFTIVYTHFGSEWSKGRPTRGLIDIESGDVENGLGFFGSFWRDTFTVQYGAEADF